jgi:hypothetical protein
MAGRSAGRGRGGFSRSGGRKRIGRAPIILGAIVVLIVGIAGGLFYFAGKAESAAKTNSLIQAEASNVSK